MAAAFNLSGTVKEKFGSDYSERTHDTFCNLDVAAACCLSVP